MTPQRILKRMMVKNRGVYSRKKSAVLIIFAHCNWPQEGLGNLLFDLTLDPKHDETLATRVLDNYFLSSLWTLNTMKKLPEEGLESLLFELTLAPKHDEELATRGARKSTL